MANSFKLPAASDTMVEGQVVEWLVAPGDKVERNQPICSLETDTTVVEMTAPFAGGVLSLGGEPGDSIAVGETLIIIDELDEPSTNEALEPRQADMFEKELGDDEDPNSANASEPNAGAAISPVVRNLAASYDIDLSKIVGTGPGGRITRGDVQELVEEAAAAQQTTAPDDPSEPDRASEPEDATPDPELGVGHTTSFTQSVQEIPQFTSMVEVDVDALLATLAALNERRGMAVPIDALVMKLLLPTLRDHRIINAKLPTTNDATDSAAEPVYFDRFDIGVAVDTPHGLIMPVVSDAEHYTIDDLGAEILRLTNAAQDGSIVPGELSGATCSINNIGAHGIVAGTSVLPADTSTIISFGATRPTVQLRNGMVREIQTMTVSATFDNRLIDSGDAGRFLADLKKNLEVPALALLPPGATKR